MDGSGRVTVVPMLPSTQIARRVSSQISLLVGALHIPELSRPRADRLGWWSCSAGVLEYVYYTRGSWTGRRRRTSGAAVPVATCRRPPVSPKPIEDIGGTCLPAVPVCPPPSVACTGGSVELIIVSSADRRPPARPSISARVPCRFRTVGL